MSDIRAGDLIQARIAVRNYSCPSTSASCRLGIRLAQAVKGNLRGTGREAASIDSTAADNKLCVSLITSQRNQIGEQDHPLRTLIAFHGNLASAICRYLSSIPSGRLSERNGSRHSDREPGW